jgi:hypothetical protein
MCNDRVIEEREEREGRQARKKGQGTDGRFRALQL